MVRSHRFSYRLLLLLLLIFKTTRRLTTADPNDEACLKNLRQNLEDPASNLRNWTNSVFSNPCSGFTSYLPGATCNNGRIYKLSLTNLSLRGSISPFLSNCTNLQSLDLSSNQISGIIPPEIQFLVNLAVLNLSSNQLSGEITPQLALCAYLNVIDLHDNQLSGQIPQQLGLLARLSAFDVSNNKLSGQIPTYLSNRTGNFPRFNASSFIGNKGLYGYPLQEMMMKSKGLSVMAIVGIGLGSGIASLMISFTGVCLWLRITEKKIVEEEGKISQSMPDY
ncbi:Leucine-rich repeat [Arabidopsis suecica]|uniref:Leucine-rich repeat n=1 Tax=Arabidopsis suecica TaxID=45249 RepID=A0A8T1ZXX0_ARASU|nr:Leucine-rich repeat [Arabidopsis suecica]